MKNLKELDKLTDNFARLPSVGQKTAERYAFSVLEMSEEDAVEFANSIIAVKKSIHLCPICGNYTDQDICDICSDKTRDSSTLIVVSYPKDVTSFEKLQSFNGKYHVLNGVLSSTGKTTVDDLNIAALLKRIDVENIKEIIIATNPTVEGETTAMYLAKLLEKKEIVVSRLAYGLPMGGHLDYADSLTLNRALEGRRKI